LAVDFLEDFLGGSRPDEGVGSVVPSVDVVTDRGGEVAHAAEVPRWMAWRSMMPNQISTMFIHDAEVGVKCVRMRGFSVSQSRTSFFLCAA
jgi:hypothetical protein